MFTYMVLNVTLTSTCSHAWGFSKLPVHDMMGNIGACSADIKLQVFVLDTWTIAGDMAYYTGHTAIGKAA